MPRSNKAVPLSCEGLGCCEEYEAVVTFACGTGTLGTLDNMTDLSWGRALDQTSTAQVTVAIPGATPECCDALGQVRSWCHELAIYRCGVLVWTGPIVSVTYAPDAVVLDARDVTAWLDRNVVDRTLSWTDADLALVADELIRDNVNLGSDAGCMVLDTRMTGIKGTRKVDAASGYVGDTLRTLAGEGLDFTALGRRLVLFGGDEPLSLIGPLTDEDFTGPIAVVDDGYVAATEAVVVGKGVIGRYAIEDPACGVLQVLKKDETITTQAEADDLAYRIVRGAYPTPLRLEVQSPAQLTQEAPVCLDMLIPGVDVRVFSRETCREVQMDLRLSSLLVQVGAGGAESVQIGLEPPNLNGFDESGE